MLANTLPEHGYHQPTAYPRPEAILQYHSHLAPLLIWQEIEYCAAWSKIITIIMRDHTFYKSQSPNAYLHTTHACFKNGTTIFVEDMDFIDLYNK